MMLRHLGRNTTQAQRSLLLLFYGFCISSRWTLRSTDISHCVYAQSSEWLNSIGHVQKNNTIVQDNSITDPPVQSPLTMQQEVEPKLLWSDEFEPPSGMNRSQKQFPNPAIWDRDVGTGEWGWGNDEYQYYTDASTKRNAYVKDGALHIVARRNFDTNTNTTTFTSARLKTDQKMFVQYGTIVARIQIPDVADGLWAGFWTLGENFRQVGWPASGEIDIMEIGDAYSLDEGNGNRRVISAAHMTRSDNNYYYNYTWTEARPVDLNLDYHLYKLEWTPTYVAMFVDDYRTHYFDIDLNICDGCEELHQPHYLIFNLAVGGLYNLRSNDIRGPERITAPFPAVMKIDYIRIYDNGFSNVYVPTPAPISASPTSLPPTVVPTSAPTDVPTDIPTTVAPINAKRPTSRPIRKPTLSPIKEAPDTPNPPNWKNIFGTNRPTNTNTTTDKDFPSIVDETSNTLDVHNYNFRDVIVWWFIPSFLWLVL